MYKIILKDIEKIHEYEELIKVFLPPEQFVLEREGLGDFLFKGGRDKDEIKREIFYALEKATGYRPPWGIVTGIRPVKMAGELIGTYGRTRGEELLSEKYLISEEKKTLALEIYDDQSKVMGRAFKNTVGLYIGIPFCPTRCLYCSFASYQVEEETMDQYLEALFYEMEQVKKLLMKKGWVPETLYVGGGTPTALNTKQFQTLLKKIKELFVHSKLKEFTIEAGRPDTITCEKLLTMKKYGVDRISINPQTMQEKTLKRIGRDHSPKDFYRSFQLAKDFSINTDLIAGLPGESLEDFQNTVEEIIKLEPENITIHSLALKRSSRLAKEDKVFHYKQGNLVEEMLSFGEKILRRKGYKPYYLYRQKQMAGALENVGYSKDGTEGWYNVRIMDEHQSIIAMGAGGISKIYYPKENRLERVPNVSNYQVYIERIEEMVARKVEKI